MGSSARVILDGVDRYRVMDPMFESVRVVLSYRGETYSPAYVQGISGSAFRIGGICPCAPTCACATTPQELLATFGYEIEYLSLCEEGMDPAAEVGRVVARVKDQIRAGRPVLVWHAFTTAEWDVVCGYDDEERRFLGRGSYAGLDGYATADQGRMATCGAICPELGAILVGDKTGHYDAQRAEIAALREAVAHAHSTENVDQLSTEGWVMLYGLACYDRWIRDFEADPPRLPTMGDRYCFGVNRSTHRAAAGFLHELAVKYGTAKEPFERAAQHFTTEAGALHEAAELLFPGWQLPAEADRELNAQVAVLLRSARDHYERGIDEVEAALVQIENAMLNTKEIVHRLAVNAEAIRVLVQAISDEQAQWQPNPETWSMAQVMEHLYNEERIDFRQHLREMLSDPPQPWGAFHDKYVPMTSCRQALDAFLREREASIAWLEALPSPDWDITSQATFVDETVTLRAGDVLVSWVDHDWAHLRQMVKLLHARLEKETAPYSTMYGGGSW